MALILLELLICYNKYWIPLLLFCYFMQSRHKANLLEESSQNNTKQLIVAQEALKINKQIRGTNVGLNRIHLLPQEWKECRILRLFYYSKHNKMLKIPETTKHANIMQNILPISIKRSEY